MDEKLQNGWSNAPVKDNNLKHQPCMLPFKQLPEEEKEKDWDDVRNYPKLVKNAGMLW